MQKYVNGVSQTELRPSVPPSVYQSLSFEDTATNAVQAEGPDRSKTLYLDGLRGIAALFVTFWHINQYFFRERDLHGYILARMIPFSFILNGPFMVNIFFVLSGRVLVERSYRQSLEDDAVKKARVLFGNLIRRQLRIFIPVYSLVLCVWLISFTPILLWHQQLFVTYVLPEVPKSLVMTVSLPTATQSALPSPFECFTFLWFEEPNHLYFYGPLWTMPVELRGSFAVYLSSVFTRAVPIGSFVCLVLVGTLMSFYGKIHYSHFLAGLALCHLHFTYSLNQLGSASDSSRMRRILRSGTFTVLPILAIIAWLCFNHETQGDYLIYPYLSRYIDAERMRLLGAVALILWVDNSSWAQRIFSRSIFTFLGRISFGLYLLHGMILYLCMTLQVSFWGRLLPDLGYGWCLIFSLPAAYLVLIIAAIGFTKSVDPLALSLGHWSCGIILAEEPVHELWNQICSFRSAMRNRIQSFR